MLVELLQSPRIKYLIIGLSAILIIVVACFLILSNKKRTSPEENQTGQSNTPATFPSVGKISPVLTGKKMQTINIDGGKNKEINLQIAEKVLYWLNTIKDQQGIYPLGELCKKGTGCNSDVKDHRVGVAVIWARYKYYQQKPQSQDLDIIKNDINIYTDKTKIKDIQNNFWNCRLMHELWQDNVFSVDYKNKIKQICDKGQHELRTLTKSWELIKNNTPISNNLEINKVLNGEAIPITMPIEAVELTAYSVAASDYTTRYNWNNKNINDLKTAQIYYSSAMQAYFLSKSSRKFFEGRWFLATASLDLYKATSNESYLNVVKYLIKQSKDDFNCETLMNCISKAFFYYQYTQFTRDINYRNKADEISQMIINRGFKEKDSNNYLSVGKEAFHAFYYGDTDFPTLENSFMVSLLTF